MTISLSGTTFDAIPGAGQRVHSYTIGDKLFLTWTTTGPVFSDAVSFTVLSLADGSVLVPPTELDTGDFTAPNGFDDSVVHVAGDGAGGYVVHLSHSVNGFIAEGNVFSPFTQERLAVSVGADGAVTGIASNPLVFVLWEDSASTSLANGNFALLSRARATQTVTLEILGPDGARLSATPVTGTFGTAATEGIFYQLTAGLEVVETGGRILALHRDSLSDEVFGQFFTQAGVSDGGEFRISDGNHGAESGAAVFQDGLLEATVLTDGRVAIVWADSVSDDVDAWVVVLNADGSVSVSERQVNTGALAQGEQFHPVVHALADGGFAITWNQNLAGAQDPGGFVQCFAADGTPVGDPVIVANGTGAGVGYGAITPSGAGVLVDWFGTATVLSGGGSGGGGGGGGGGGPVGTVVTGTDASEVLSGTAGGDTIIGNGGEDTLRGQAGNDFLTGESVEIAAGTPGAQVYRIYGATLGRAPDTGGLTAWSSRLESESHTVLEVIRGFVASPEFQRVYGALDDDDFIFLLYNNVLGRDPDATGLGNWLGRLSDGISRERVVLGFSESSEFKAKTGVAASVFAEAASGRSQAAAADDVYRLYQATLDRAPDQRGLENWSDKLGNGQAYTSIAAGFTNSVEFRMTYGDVDNAGFIDLLYRNVLDRAPDSTGQAAWLGRMVEGMSREGVVRGFAQSPEFDAKTAASFIAYMKGLAGDVFNGGAGDDTLAGSLQADTFVFNAQADGRDLVLQLDAWDMLRFEGFGYDSRADATQHMAAFGADVRFADQGVEIVFAGTGLDRMQEVDFLFT